MHTRTGHPRCREAATRAADRSWGWMDEHLAYCSACRSDSLSYTGWMDNHRLLVLSGKLWCGLCYEGRRERQHHNGHGKSHGRSSGVKKCMALKKPSGNGSGGVSSTATPSPGKLLTDYPTLLEFLTLRMWEDGSPRQPGTLLIFVDSGTWKACLKDKNGPRVCFVSSSDLDMLFLTVEDGLSQDNLDWRADRPQGGQRR